MDSILTSSSHEVVNKSHTHISTHDELKLFNRFKWVSTMNTSTPKKFD